MLIPNSSDYHCNSSKFTNYTYEINNIESWNSIRIQGNGKRSLNNYLLVIYQLEFYGKFITNIETCMKTSLKFSFLI